MLKQAAVAALLCGLASTPVQAVTFEIGEGFACPAGVCQGDATQQWFARARNFDSSANDFELGIGTEPPLNFLDTEQLTWGAFNPFVLAYDASTQTGSFTVGQTTVSAEFGGPFTELFVQFKNSGNPAGDVITVSFASLFVNGISVGTGGVEAAAVSDGPPAFLRFFDFESALSEGFQLTGSINLTGVPSAIASEALAVDFILAGPPSSVPEPEMLVLFGLGIAGLMSTRRRA